MNRRRLMLVLYLCLAPSFVLYFGGAAWEITDPIADPPNKNRAADLAVMGNGAEGQSAVVKILNQNNIPIAEAGIEALGMGVEEWSITIEPPTPEDPKWWPLGLHFVRLYRNSVEVDAAAVVFIAPP